MKRFWKWLSGKKTIIATFYNSVTWPAIMVIAENTPPNWLVKVNIVVGLILTFVGLGHKIIKKTKKNK